MQQISLFQFKFITKKIIELENPYVVVIGEVPIIVPKGFQSDGASIPKCFEKIFPRFELKYLKAAVVHDFLYSRYNDLGINKQLADEIFLYILKQQGVPKIKRELMYAAVKVFGKPFWKEKYDENNSYKQKAWIDKSKASKEYYESWYKKLGFK